MIFLLLSVILIGAIATFFESGKKITTRSGAATPTTVTLSSLSQIPGLAQTAGAGNTFTVIIPAWLYKQIYVTGAGYFCSNVRWCTNPYDAKFGAAQNIWSSATYITKTGKITLSANYYFFASGGKAQITLMGCTFSTRACTTTEKNYSQNLLNKVLMSAYNAYSQYVDVMAISNDTANLTIIFTAKALPMSITPMSTITPKPVSIAPMTPTPTQCIDKVPPFAPYGITYSLTTTGYKFSWGISGCASNPKKYLFRRYTASPAPSGNEANCTNTTSGSCWTPYTYVEKIPIDFNNSACFYSDGIHKACYVYVWAKDANNNISSASVPGLVLKP